MPEEDDKKDAPKIVHLDGGGIEVDGKKYISKESHDVVAEKYRTTKAELEDKSKESKAEEKKRLEEEGNYKKIAEEAQAEVEKMKADNLAKAKTDSLASALKEAGAKNPATMAKLLDQDSLTVGSDGTVEKASLDTQLASLKESEPYLFGDDDGKGDDDKQKTAVGGAGGGAADKGAGGGDGKVFKRSQLSDHDFYTENRADILEATRLGNIEDDIS